MTEGKSVAPSASCGSCTIEVLLGMWTPIDMPEEGKSVGGKATSSPCWSCAVEVRAHSEVLQMEGIRRNSRGGCDELL